MKKRPHRYQGNGRVRALLDRYACPTPFHVVRTRFLGNIARPNLDASPLPTIANFWGGKLPQFSDVAAANELFQALMDLWNELTRHQSGTRPFRLTRMVTKEEPGDLGRLCRTRTEELEGFIDGLFGAEEVLDLPERAHEAMDNLGEINAMMHGMVECLERTSSPSEMDPAQSLTNVRELSRIAEKELHAVVVACTRARQHALSTIGVEKPTIH